MKKENEKFEFKKQDVSCPICENPCNKLEKLHYYVGGAVVFLAECWSGNVDEDKPRHIFLVKVKSLPEVNFNYE